MKFLTSLTIACFALALTPAFGAEKESAKKTCCEKAADDGKDCTHKCCVAAHKDGKSCVHCNPDKQDLKLKKKDKKADTKAA